MKEAEERDFKAEKNQNKCKNQMSNFVFMSYGHFPARNESKLHSCHLKSEKNQQGTDES